MSFPSPPSLRLRPGFVITALLLPAYLCCRTAAVAAEAGPGARGTAPPEYRFDVLLDPKAHTIEGELLITLDAGDPRIGAEWRFHLPPNRFLAVDSRGRRRNTDAPPFERRSNGEALDPLLPSGFAPNGIDILSVRDARGELKLQKEGNPRIPQGYFAEGALMRVTAPDGRPLRAVQVRFRTHLPNRYVEGWSESGVFIEYWHPSLANRASGEWDLEPESPRAARFAGRIEVAEKGWLAVGPGLLTRAQPGARLDLPEGLSPARSLPLVFMPKAEAHAFGTGDGQGYSLSLLRGDRIERISRTVAERFLMFVKTEYGLSLPRLAVFARRKDDAAVADARPAAGEAAPAETPGSGSTSPGASAAFSPGTPSAAANAPSGLVLVQWDLPLGDLRTLGHIVLIPKVHRHDDPLLDRVYAAQLAKAIGRVWFGATVWADEDRESWLPLGMSGFLALDFFESLYGWDGRVHALMDWLNPRYREHFLEAPVRGIIYNGQDAPLLISLTGHPYERTATVVAHFKSVLVLRMLSFVMGKDAFRRAVTTLYADYAYRTATHEDFQGIASRSAGEPVDWFFSDWFAHAPRLDFQIQSWSETGGNGSHAVDVVVRRTGVSRMPIEVEVTDVLGGKTAVRYEGNTEIGTVHVSLPAEGVSIRLDPKEYLLEPERRNDQSSPSVKLRPFYDWTKASDILITVQGTLGGNAIDGNYAGLGLSVPIDDISSVDAIPIYGERTGWADYELSYRRSQFLVPRLGLNVAAIRLGGAQSQTASFTYGFLTPDWLRWSSTMTARFEQVDSATRTSGDTAIIQPSGPANNLGLGSGLTFLWSESQRTFLSASVERSEPGFYSNFTYTRWNGTASQTLQFNPSHRMSVALYRSGIEGQAPIQKDILIGGPSLLRGYPRTLKLVNEQMEAVRMDYAATLARGVWGSALQLRKVTAFLFADAGKGWDNQQSPDDVPQRQDVGVGLEVRLSAIGVVEFPARIDIAFPVNDRQYTSPQIILFEALAF